MNETRPYWKVIVSLVFSLLATTVVIVGGVSLLRFLMPFVIGWIIATIANPLVCWLEKNLKILKKWGTAITIILVIGMVVGFLYLICSLLIKEIGGLMGSLPELYKTVESNLQGVIKVLPDSVRNAGVSIMDSMKTSVGEWITDLREPTVSIAGNVAKSIPHLIIASFVAIISAYFFVADRETVMNWTRRVTPKPIYDRMKMVVSDFKFSVGGYFKAQFKIMGVVGVILFIGLTILKVRYAIVLSIVIAFLDFLPFLGTGCAFVPWCIYTFLTGDYKRFIILLVIYATTQIVRQTIQPKLVGDEVGLKPLPTLLFIYIGYRLGGIIWMIIAVPVGLIVINMYKAGAFDYILDDVKVLVKGILSLRK